MQHNSAYLAGEGSSFKVSSKRYLQHCFNQSSFYFEVLYIIDIKAAISRICWNKVTLRPSIESIENFQTYESN